MNNAILVGLGGFAGSIMRYLVSGYVQQVTKSAAFPYGTMAVNLAGCFIIGLLSQLADSRGVFTPARRALSCSPASWAVSRPFPHSATKR